MPMQDLLTLHQQILDGEPTAPAKLVEATAGPITGMVIKIVGLTVLDLDDAKDAATDALIAYLQNPSAYVSQGEASLFTYLLRIAQRRAIDCIRRKKRHKEIFPVSVEEVELESIESEDDFEKTEAALDATTIINRFGTTIVKNAVEEELLRLHLASEKSTDRYAEVLGINNRPIEEQRALVKRHRDRLERRLMRIGERL